MKNINKQKRTIFLFGVLTVIVMILIFFTRIQFHDDTNPDTMDVEDALSKAGTNRSQLEEVLAHYRQKPKDQLKYRAACFLIREMPHYFCYEGKLLDQYLTIYDELATSTNTPQAILGSYVTRYGQFSTKYLQEKFDVNEISASYLIDQIDWAFKVWREQPWGKNVSFENFCEFVLPYRIGNERLESWRSVLYEKYNPLLDSLRKTPEAKDPLAAAKVIITVLSKEEKYFTTFLPDLPNAGPSINDRCRAGTCRELADFTTYVLRALGIPSGIDFMPSHAKLNSDHLWTFILDKKGKSYVSDFLNGKIIPSSDAEYHSAKVYRRTFSLNRTLILQMSLLENSVPNYFRKPYFTDVTFCYFSKKITKDIVIPKEEWYYDDRESERPNIIYLCVPFMRGWRPVAWESFDGKTLRFKAVKTQALFRIAAWMGGQLVFYTNPFIAYEKTGEIKFLYPDQKSHSVTLFAKYDCTAEQFTKKMVGGVFEADNDSTLCLENNRQLPHHHYFESKVVLESSSYLLFFILNFLVFSG